MTNAYTNNRMISPEVDELIPSGMIIYCSSDKCYTFLDRFIDIIDLVYTLTDKLLFIAKYVNKNKVSFINCLSSSDKEIILQLIDDISAKEKLFWNKLLTKNEISYRDSLYNKVNSDIEIFKKQDRKTHKYFYKWFNLDQYSEQKVDTIINNKVYIPSPLEFNDRFDCQLHLSNEDIYKIVETNVHNEQTVRFIELLLNNMPRVCSFSLNNPIHIESNSMWGIYSNCSKWFAVSYKILDIITLLVKSHFDVKNDSPSFTIKSADNIDSIDFKKIVYSELNIFDAFKTAVHKYCKENDMKPLQNFLSDDFLVKKSLYWKYENEFRLFKLINPLQLKDYLDKPVNDSSYKKIANILEENMNNEIGSESRREKFIAPNKIILGWKCNLENTDIIRLCNYAKLNRIEVAKLNGKINYQRKQFEVAEIEPNIG